VLALLGLEQANQFRWMGERLGAGG
jgi:hypothetical protein